mmetsp:Transcript_18200/g.49425  ORF Transcript_18200/g.49425 Transcript_18200/m.49425 type:complete len:85 (+) Transcript_18200:102-356(+)
MLGKSCCGSMGGNLRNLGCSEAQPRAFGGLGRCCASVEQVFGRLEVQVLVGDDPDDVDGVEITSAMWPPGTSRGDLTWLGVSFA